MIRKVIPGLEGFEEGSVGRDRLGPGLGRPEAVVALLMGGVGAVVEVAGGLGETSVGFRVWVGRVEAGVGGLEVEEEKDQRGDCYGGEGEPV